MWTQGSWNSRMIQGKEAGGSQSRAPAVRKWVPWRQVTRKRLKHRRVRCGHGDRLNLDQSSTSKCDQAWESEAWTHGQIEFVSEPATRKILCCLLPSLPLG